MQRAFPDVESDVAHLAAVIESLFRQVEGHLHNGQRHAESADNAAMDLAVGDATRNMHLVAGLIKTFEEYLDELAPDAVGRASESDRMHVSAFVTNQRVVEALWRARLTQNQEAVVEIENLQDTPPLAG